MRSLRRHDREPASVSSAPASTRSRPSAQRRNRHSTAFTRRSLGLSATRQRRTSSTPADTAAPPFDALALVRRCPPAARAFAHVKSGRKLGMFSKFERYWLELRGRIVVLVVDDHIWPSGATPKEPVIAGVFSVENCSVSRPRAGKSSVIRLSKRAQPINIWLKFESDPEADIWEKALANAASERVVSISDFEFISPIGKGASGKVFLVADRKTGEKLALKVIDKTKVFDSRSGFRHALDERLALQMVDGHPFFSRLRYAFQTRSFFYLAIDFYDGGDLYQYLRTHHGRLREHQVRSVAAEVSLALEHLHNLGFVYRDLKPENVLLDTDGHVRLADFGLCKLLPNRALTNTICGTHTYAAPEMLAVRNYGLSIDLWAFGVFVYHILRGRTPYEARDLDQVIANMNNRRIRFSSSTSPELVAMIKKLLDWNPETRLGCSARGMVDVRSHEFFKGVQWRKVFLRQNTAEGLFAKQTKLRAQTQDLAVGTQQQQQQQQTNEACGPTAPTPMHMRVHSPSTGTNSTMDAATGTAASENAFNEVNREPSDEIDESPLKTSTRGSRTSRLNRPKSAVYLGLTRRGSRSPATKDNESNEVAHDQSSSLRERMIAAAEKDDLRNFDMAEWGKISVDNDHDDPTYGDSSLWPISKARRRLVEDERMIAGFSYCSTSTPFSLPDNL